MENLSGTKYLHFFTSKIFSPIKKLTKIDFLTTKPTKKPDFLVQKSPNNVDFLGKKNNNNNFNALAQISGTF